MSNPAVVKLAQGKVGKSKVWLDDNYGESIHLHIDDYRVDMTVEEFSTLYNDSCDILNDLASVKNLDFRNIDPVFLSLFLWKKIPSLISAKIDNVYLEDLLAPHNTTDRIFKLSESVGVRALNGTLKNSEEFRESHHISQTEKERMSIIYESIKKQGYPYNNQYIILFGDDNIIRDGQHRASCLYYLNGNIKIPVLRLGFSDYKSPNVHKYYNSYLFRKIRSVQRHFRNLLSLIKQFLLSIRHLFSRVLRRMASFRKS